MNEGRSKWPSTHLGKPQHSRNATEGQHSLCSNACSSSSSLTLSAGVDSAGSSDACRKKSGFVITRIDKNSISSALENESDMENEYCGAGGCRSPGSSSVISESSSIFEDGTSPMVDKTALPKISVVKETSTTSGSGKSTVSIPVPTQQSSSTSSGPVSASINSKPTVAPLTLVPEHQTGSTTTKGSTISAPPVQSPVVPKSAKDMPSSASTGRFHIIKIDAGPYKRGRWNCRDFDETCTNSATSGVRSDLIALGGARSGSSNCSSGRASYGQQTPVALLSTTTDQQNQQHDPVSDSKQRASSPLASDISTITTNSGQQHSTNLSATSIASQKHPSPGTTISSGQQLSSSQKTSTNKIPGPTGVDFNNAAAAILDSIIVGSMHRQNDHHHLLTSSVASGENGDTSTVVRSQSATDSSNGAAVQNAGPASAGASVVAIDNKIEQAMDLVKTHLLYAVREEVEVLKEKIIDLEKKVFRLETENKLLREYAPPEILQQIQHQGGQSQQVPPQQQPPSSAISAPNPIPPQSQPAVSADLLTTGASTNTNGQPALAIHSATPPSSS